MIKVAIYGKRYNEEMILTFVELFNRLKYYKSIIFIYKALYDYIVLSGIKPDIEGIFENEEEVLPDFNYFFSLGGDGTFLESALFVKNKNIPVVGINSGRLGFLANIPKNAISQSVDYLYACNYEIEGRSLIEVVKGSSFFPKTTFALNDVTIQKSGSSLITVHAYIDGAFVCSYWTDGLIVSTPTGSTAYSLSVGGPIMAPDCENFIISPIASHNLSVRPLVISDKHEVLLKVEARNNKFLVSLDHNTIELSSEHEISLKKAPFSIKVLKFKHLGFFDTIREKLSWGKDIRNKFV